MPKEKPFGAESNKTFKKNNTKRKEGNDMGRKIALISSIIFISTISFAKNYDFKDFSLALDNGGAFILSLRKQKILSGMLFLSAKSDKKIDSRFFQNSNFIKDQTSPVISMEEKDVSIALSGKMKHKKLGVDIPFSEKIKITRQGKLEFSYDLNIPEDLKFQSSPRILLSIYFNAVGGKGLWQKTNSKEELKTIDKEYRKGKTLNGNHLTNLKIATDSGPLEFIPLSGEISYHDTRSYQKNGWLRVDIPGAKKDGKWNVAFTIQLPVKSVEITQSLLREIAESKAAEKRAEAQKKLKNFKPDFKTWDIYLPHLKRKHLSGWWKLKMLPGTEENPKDDAGTKGGFYKTGFDDSKWKNAMVPGDWHKPFMKDARSVNKSRKEFGGIGWYRLTFKAPEAKPGEHAILHFDEIINNADVYLNGRKIGSHANKRIQGMHTTREDFELDATNAIRFGKENTLAVRVYHSGKPINWGWAARGGITRRVYLDIRPQEYCKEILITPNEDLKGASFDCMIEGSENPSSTEGWKAEAFEWNSGKKVAESTIGAAHEKEGKLWAAGKISIPNAKQWSCESPFLYGLKIKNKAGETVGIKRFGMRTFHVKKGTFLLNGKPTMLRGIVKGEHEFSKFTGDLFIHNDGDALKRYFKALRDANVNHARFHTSLMTPAAYDILDELGFLITDEINYPAQKIKDPKVADKIEVQGIDYACEKNGKLKPEFMERVKNRMNMLYSHPCIATFSFGNEMRGEDQCGKMFNNLYDLYSKLDKQDRPITPSSGRFWKSGNNLESLSKKDKLDYIDTHDYTGSINNWPIGYCQVAAENFIRLAKKYYPNKKLPIINGETVYFANHYYPQFYDKVWESEDSPEPNWEKHIWALTKMDAKYPAHRKMSYYWVRCWGSKNYKYHQNLGRGIYTERILDVQRKLWPDLDGFENLSGKYFSKPTPKFPLQESKLIPNEAYDSLRQVCAPAVVVLDYLPPNRYSGEPISSKAYAINNSEKALENAKIKIAIKKDGKILSEKELPVGKLAVGQKKILPFEILTPDVEGSLELDYMLLNDSKVLCDRKLGLNLRKKENVFKTIPTEKKICLYDAVEKVFTGMGQPNATKVLKAYGLPFKRIDNFDDLKNCDLLIIGANSFDSELEKNADKIRNYIENGGNVLIFEQTRMGRIPFMRGLEYVQAGAGQFAEKVRGNHPTIKDMSQNEFFCWDQKDWAVYHSFVSPLSEAAILVGGDSTTWGSDNFGMVAAHLKLGNGTVLISQAEITPRFEKDSGAGQFTRNLLLTALDDSAKKLARKFRGKPVKAEPLSKEKAYFISLTPAANMAFADEIAGDGKGGWSDQGPNNDLKALPLGIKSFDGIYFNIANPKENDGKSCVVVSANPSLPFKPTSAPIPVNKKLKRIIFLHTGAWMGKENTLVGKYIIKYASGRTLEIPLTTGEEIADWWNAPGQKISKGQCVWSSKNGSSVIGAFAYSWKNPRPNDEIKSITAESFGKAAIGVLGISGEAI